MSDERSDERFDAVLCDFDGVLRLWDPDGMAALDRKAGLAEGTLASAAFRPELLADAFDAVVNTARTGFAKPDRRVFEAAAEAVGVKLQRCLFVDDTPGHVAAAQAAGLTGIHYRHVDQLRSATAPLRP